MSGRYFEFKRFKVFHDQCGMKVGTDGVMLGAWADVIDKHLILDVGTGSGLIALMLAQRTNAQIHAVEIDEQACLQASQNVLASPWKDRIQVVHDSFQHAIAQSTVRYDLITCNPPFFRNSLKPSVQHRSLARHDVQLNLTDLFFYSAMALTLNGLLVIIIPAGEVDHAADLAYMRGLASVRQTFVRPYPGKDPARCLIEFAINKKQICWKNELTIRKDDKKQYTHEYITLTRDFYLKM